MNIKIALIRLNLIQGIGVVIADRLIKKFPDIVSIFERSAHELMMIKGISNGLAKEITDTKYLRLAEDEIKLADDNGISIVTKNDKDYPLNFALQSIVSLDAPQVLYVKGKITDSDKISVALVGSRNPTYQGRESAKMFAGSLVQAGFTIVSGFARGIDIEAQRAAINSGGRSLAFIGSGLLNVYPPENREFINEITKNGALVSEFPLKTPPVKGNFPRRNRLIAAMSLGTLVIEAGLKSGALITARLASEYGREVFALPARYNDQKGIGCNKLIQDGVKLVLDVKDILSELPKIWVDTGVVEEAASKKRKSDLFGDTDPASPGSMNKLEKNIYDILSTEPLHVEQISGELKESIKSTVSALVMLEVKGLIKQLAGRHYIKIN